MVTGKGKEKKPREFKNNLGAACRVERCLCAGKRGRSEAAASVWKRRGSGQRGPYPACCHSVRPLDSSAPAGCSPGTRCVWAAFGSTAWSSVGLAMKHRTPGRMGGPVGPEGIPAHPGTPGRSPCPTGLQGGKRGSEERAGRGGQSPARGGTMEVSPPACSSAACVGCQITAGCLPAAAQVEGASFPTGSQWGFVPPFQGLEGPQILPVAPGGSSAQPAHKRLAQGPRLHPFLLCRALCCSH